MAEHLRAKANDRYTQPNGPAINGQPVPVQSKAWKTCLKTMYCEENKWSFC